jgi:hypothetical protein
MDETICLTSDQIIYAVNSVYEITEKAVTNFFYLGVLIGIVFGIGIGVMLAYYWRRNETNR